VAGVYYTLATSSGERKVPHIHFPNRRFLNGLP